MGNSGSSQDRRWYSDLSLQAEIEHKRVKIMMENAHIVSEIVQEAMRPRHYLSQEDIDEMLAPKLPPGWVQCGDFVFHRELLMIKKNINDLPVYSRKQGGTTKNEQNYHAKGLRFLEQLIGKNGECLKRTPKEISSGLKLTYKKSVIRDIKPYASYARDMLRRIGSGWTVSRLTEYDLICLELSKRLTKSTSQ